MTRRRALMIAAFASPLASLARAGVAPVPAAGVAEALLRPAVKVREVGHAVLLDAALAGARVVAVGERGVIAVSDDAARRWRQAEQVPASVGLTAVRFADAEHGWAVGHGGVVLRTDDGGDHWVRQLDGSTFAQIELDAAQSATPVDPQRIKTAQRWLDEGADKPWLDLHVADDRHAVIIGAYGLIAATADGGRTWQSWTNRVDNPKGLHLYAITELRGALFIAGEQGLLLRASNPGARFKRLAAPYEGSWFAACATTGGWLVAAGLRGHAAASADGGDHWSLFEAATPASFVSVLPLDDDHALLADQAGQIVVASRATASLEPLPIEPLPALQSLVLLPGGDLLALTGRGAVRVPKPAGVAIAGLKP